MRKVKLLIFGGANYLLAPVAAAWDRAGVELIGPIPSLTEWLAVRDSIVDGAIIDIDLDTGTLIALSDALEEASIPSLFATSSPVEPDYRGFELAVRPETINAILTALFGTGDLRVH